MGRPKITTGGRRGVAQRHQVACNGEPHPVECAYCGTRGTITWWPSSTFRRTTWCGDHWERTLASGDVIESTLEFDHIIALSRGGANTAENLILACSRCNASKGNRTIDEWVAVLTSSSRLKHRDRILDRLGVST